MNANLSTQYEKQELECIELRKENANLLTQLASLNAKLSKRTWEFFTRKPTLLIGDSLIQDIDQHKLDNTIVKSIRGAKIKDISSHISRNQNRYNKIVICAGTNNCSSDMNIEAVADHFSDLLQVATERVACVDNVVISSIPPRTDCVERQQRVEELNTVLQDMSAKVGAKLISNDTSFRLADGQPNDGYLRKDGLHLNLHGTTRINRIFGLSTTSTYDDTEGRHTKEDANDDWQTVRRKYVRRRNTRDMASHRRRDDQYEQHGDHGRRAGALQHPHQQRQNGTDRHPAATHRHPGGASGRLSGQCAKCGEMNHTTAQCKHHHEVQCRQCGEYGHKDKHHGHGE